MWQLAILIALLPCIPSPVSAETLAEAIAMAYQSNPTLQSQRAQLRALDETYVQAKRQYGPSVTAQGNARYTQDQLRNSFSGTTALPDTTIGANAGTAQVNIIQPLYTGGRVTLETRAAEFRIRAGREALRVTEGDIVYGVIQAYVDVRRDTRALDIRKTNRAAIALELKEIRARWHAGEVTRTDVGQAEAQLAAEQANVSTSENQLQTSRIAYATIVGRNPGELSPETHLPNVPKNLHDAWSIAEATSPEFQQARFTEEQSRARFAATRTAGRPNVSLQSSFGYTSELFPFGRKNYDRALVAELVVSMPLFNSGLSRSAVRQAAEQNNSDRLSIEASRRLMVQNVTNAWDQILTFRENVDHQRAQIDAATLAFKGMRIEYRAGQRSTLDVLIAEEVLRDAELAELAAQHDEFLSEALLLRYVGRLDAGDIVASLPRYEPADHFRKVEHKGETPWEPLIHRFDSILLAQPNQQSLAAPAGAIDAHMAAPNGNPDENAEHATEVPIAPLPGTVSNVAPPIFRPKP